MNLPSHICFGYILLTNSVEEATRVSEQLEDFVNSQTIIKTLDLWQGYAFEGFIQHYLTFLFDRSIYTPAEIKKIAEEVNFKGHRLRVMHENLYDKVSTLPPFPFNSGPDCQMKIVVESEWKGFGNFS